MLHSFFLPNLRVKQDVVPGMKQYVWFQAKKTGVFDIVCAELCGWGHYKMRGRLTVESRADFDAWLGGCTTSRKRRPWRLRTNDMTNGMSSNRPLTSVVRILHEFHTSRCPFARSPRRACPSWQFLATYVFSIDHKIIGMQFLFSTLLWFLVGGLLALGIRWQLAWPWTDMPVIGRMLFRGEGRADFARVLHDAVHDARHGDDLSS